MLVKNKLINQSKINEIIEAVRDIDKRVMKLEASSKEIENKITASNEQLDLIEEKSIESLNQLKQRSNENKKKINIINQNITKSITIIKHLAHKKDISLLKDKLNHLKIDEQVTHKDIKNMVIERLNIQKSSLN